MPALYFLAKLIVSLYVFAWGLVLGLYIAKVFCDALECWLDNRQKAKQGTD